MPRRTKKSKKLEFTLRRQGFGGQGSKKSAIESGKIVKKPKKVQLSVRINQKAENRPTDATPPVKITEVKEAMAGKQQMSEKKREAKKKEVIKKTQLKKKTKKQPQDVKQSDPEKIERDKRFMMWAGVAFFMVLIFGVWIFNIKNVFKTTENTDINSSAVQEWDKIADEFSATLEKVKEGIAELKEAETEEEGRDIFSETATTSDDAVISGDDEIEELKKRLEELESKVGGEQATSTPDM